jgi:hypothetical protein
MKWRKGYKVVVKDRGRYYSCLLPKGVRQEYRIGHVTKIRSHIGYKSGWGELAVFINLKDARKFRSFQVEKRKVSSLIFQCKYKPSLGVHLRIPARVLTSRYQFHWLLDGEGQECMGSAVYRKNGCVPSGTAFAEAVELVKRIW